jgi:hypothetical protein
MAASRLSVLEEGQRVMARLPFGCTRLSPRIAAATRTLHNWEQHSTRRGSRHISAVLAALTTECAGTGSRVNERSRSA